MIARKPIRPGSAQSGACGNPVKGLHLSQPLSDVIATAFRNALNARGMLASGNPAPLSGSDGVKVRKSTQMARREAEASLTLDVIDRATGRGLYHDTTDVDLVSGSILALDTGVFASPADLQALAQNALVQAIDRLLDNPSFVAVVRRQQG